MKPVVTSCYARPPFLGTPAVPSGSMPHTAPPVHVVRFSPRHVLVLDEGKCLFAIAMYCLCSCLSIGVMVVLCIALLALVNIRLTCVYIYEFHVYGYVCMYAYDVCDEFMRAMFMYTYDVCYVYVCVPG